MAQDKKRLMPDDEFFEKLRETRASLSWGYRESGAVRAVDRPESAAYDFCPITAVHHLLTGRYYNTQFYGLAAQELRIPFARAFKIASAADGTGRDPELRRRIIEAVGLTEVA